MRDLVTKVSNGEVRIPRFQRPLRWDSQDVVKLFDSVWRGYPIGSLLFWKRQAKAETIVIGGARIAAPELADAWWLVDGQQRTIAFAAALLELDHQTDHRWAIWFDPEQRRFVSTSDLRDVSDPVPLAVLGDLRRLGRWLRKRDLEEETVDVIEEAQQKILDYSIPAYIVDTENAEAIRAIFARLNSTGKRMRADDVFQALIGTREVKNERVDLEALQSACEDDDFGVPSRGEVLKAALAASGLDPVRRPEEIDPDALRERLESEEVLEDALRRTSAFFRMHCLIPNVRLIPYPVTYTILARWFALFPATPPSALSRLVRWVWRGATTAAHQRGDVSSMRRQVNAIVPGDLEGSLDRLLEFVSGKPLRSWKLENFDHRSARSRIELLALFDAKPLDPFGPVGIRALVQGEQIAKKILPKGKVGDDASFGTVANRILLDMGLGNPRVEVTRWNGTDRTRLLSSHLISPAAFEALQRDDSAAFLALRTQTLSSHVASFANLRCGWDEPVVRPVEYYRSVVG